MMKSSCLLTLTLVAILALPGTAPWAQETKPDVEARLQKLEGENAELRQLLQQLREEIESLTADEEGPGDEGFELPDIDELISVEATAPQSEGATGQATGDPLLNPIMSFTFDFAANALDKQPELYAIDGRSKRRFLGLRSLGMRAQRGVSAYGDAFVVYGDHGHGFGLEEAYIDVNRLVPKANLRLGKWRLDFGPYNRVHEHQLPFVNCPRSLGNFFGHGGVYGIGAEVSYLLPTEGYTELRAALLDEMRGGHGHVFSTDQSSNSSYSGHLRHNRELGNDTDLNLTLSYLDGPVDDAPHARAHAYNAALQWRKTKGTQRSDRVILEWTGVDRETDLGDLDRSGFSATYFKQAGMYHDWGLMYESAEFGEPGILGRAKGYNAFYTYKAQETQRFRLQYRRGTYPTGPDTDEVFLQSIWSIGPHSHEFN